MGRFFDIAKPVVERGFRVFPLIRGKKQPVKMAEGDHFDAATTDLEAIEAWDKAEPNCNLGFSPDEFHCFVETDSEQEFIERATAAGVDPKTWTTTRVSSGRPDRAYYIFRQTNRTRAAGDCSGKSERTKDNLFEFKQQRTLVVAPGSVHPLHTPDHPLIYTAEWHTIFALPDALLTFMLSVAGKQPTTGRKMNAETQVQTTLLEQFCAAYDVAVHGDWRNKGKSWYLNITCPWTEEHTNDSGPDSTCIVYTEDGGYGFACKHRCESKSWKEFRAEVQGRYPDKKFNFVAPTPDNKVIIGGLPVTDAELAEAMAKHTADVMNNRISSTDWRSLFHTWDEVDKAPPISFLISGFLQREGITGLAAPVRSRKTITAFNIVHSLLTGDKLFGHFDTENKPSHVLYMCPEVSIGPFSDRIKAMGLGSYCGKTLFCRTLSSQEAVKLDNPLLLEGVKDSVVFLDTAIRFLEGNENDSSDVRVFADTCFKLLNAGAESVVLLHHSPKGNGDGGMTLENALRGSGDMGAFMAACWGTKLQDPEHPYQSLSYFENLKQRDFESDPFETSCDASGKMEYIVQPEGAKVKLNGAGGRENKEGHADAIAWLKANPGIPAPAAQKELLAIGIDRSQSWVKKQKFELLKLNGGKLG